MFVILTYDVNTKRVAKVLKTARKYLTHVQNSVLEGYLTEGRLNKLKRELAGCVDPGTDSVRFYVSQLPLTRMELGVPSPGIHEVL